MSNYLGISYLVPVDPSIRLVPAKHINDHDAPLLQRRKKKYPKKLEYYEAIELLAWILLMCHNFAIYIASLQLRGTDFNLAILMLFLVSLTQPTFYLVSVQTKHKVLNTACATLILVISLYLGTQYEEHMRHHRQFLRWIQVSSYVMAGFTLWGVIKHPAAKLKHNHQIFSLLAAVFLGALTYSVKWVHHAHFKSPEYLLLTVAFVSFFMVLLPGCLCCGGKFLRFLLKLSLIVGQVYVVYYDSFEKHVNLEYVQVLLSRTFSVVHMILTLRALWKMEQELKEEGEFLYNRRIAHDRFTH